MATAPNRKFRVLFLCTGNSARSQMAEALLNWKGEGRFEAESAGSHPAPAVNPYAAKEIRDRQIPWVARAPRSVQGLEREHWDLVITVCDRARETCPIFPGRPVTAHWSTRDPVEEEDFREAFLSLSRRVDQLVALPLEQLARSVAEAQVKAIG
jgi:arsenate reductase